MKCTDQYLLKLEWSFVVACLCVVYSGFVRVMENLESHEIVEIIFLGLESH